MLAEVPLDVLAKQAVLSDLVWSLGTLCDEVEEIVCKLLAAENASEVSHLQTVDLK